MTNTNIYKYSNGQFVQMGYVEEPVSPDHANSLLDNHAFARFSQVTPFLRVGPLANGNDFLRSPYAYYDVENAKTWITGEVMKLHFKASYELLEVGNEETVEIPTFQSNNSSIRAVHANLVVQPREEFYEFHTAVFRPYRLFAMCNLHTSEVYLILINANSARLLPIPNQYDNGKICMGDAYRPPEGCLDRLNTSMESLLSSVWNTDLFGDWKQSKFNEMFRFKNGLQVPTDWDETWIKDRTLNFGPSPLLQKLIEQIQRKVFV